MQNRKLNLQENINSYSEATSSEQQRDVGNLDTVKTQPSYSLDIISYKLDFHEKQINTLQEHISEINKPLVDKLTKYKEVLVGAATFITAILSLCFALYKNNLDEKFNSHLDRIKANSETIKKNDEEISNLSQRLILIEYKIDGQSKDITKK